MNDNIQNEVIVTEGVKKIYSDNGVPVKAIRGIDLTIRKGEFTAIVGPSGCGKTTFLNIISGLDTVSEGKVWKELSDFRRDNIGFIFQAYNLIPVLTVEENVEYIMLLQGVSKSERQNRVHEILAELGLDGFAGRLPTRLSGGQQQRVAIARAMVSRPTLILADEPTANLDSKAGGGLLDMMRELNEKSGMTFVFSTHDRSIMERAKRLITLSDGMIQSDETRE